MPVLR
ncbi:uncharacterized protein FFC1_15166 [Fusarium fujikuroi]